VFVTRHSNVTSAELRDKLWYLYERAYQPMATEAVTRETFYRHEFDELLSDPTNRLWVAWQDQVPVAAAMIATDIAATRYLSRTYFEHHFPEHSLRSVVHYVLWVVVHPAHVAKGTLVRLSKEAFALEADEGALLVFDAPQVHQPEETGGFAEMMHRTGNMVSPGTRVAQIEVQRYYVADFAVGARHLEQLAEHAGPPVADARGGRSAPPRR
jgi:hypothetical protein